jgi:nucleotide-binding universal stress UspA family protein
MMDLRRILVPTDFSKHSQNALRYGAAFAEKFAAELYLLHIVQDLALFIPDNVTGVPLITPPVEQLIAAARQTLERTVKDAALPPEITVRLEAREGSPFYEIIQYAKEIDVDLIVMGTHGHTGLVHVLLGSVAEKVRRPLSRADRPRSRARVRASLNRSPGPCRTEDEALKGVPMARKRPVVLIVFAVVQIVFAVLGFCCGPAFILSGSLDAVVNIQDRFPKQPQQLDQGELWAGIAERLPGSTST